MGTKLLLTKGISIPLSELQFRFSRSGGHGGQNVNKVETRVVLLFDLAHSKTLTVDQRQSIMKQLHSRVGDDGMLQLVAQRSRNQWRNRQDAIERFIEIMRKALTPKKPRRATRASASSIEKRIQDKKRRSDIKKARRQRE